jgi:hypothetical protein
MSKSRIVLDSNVILSAALFKQSSPKFACITSISKYCDYFCIRLPELENGDRIKAIKDHQFMTTDGEMLAIAQYLSVG